MKNLKTEAVRKHLKALYDDYLSVDGGHIHYPQMPDSDRFGLAFATVEGETAAVGDCEWRFPMHSIGKVFTYGLALEDNGREETLRRVGAEPSGEAYNAIRFDVGNNRPFNAMINSGALVATHLVRGSDREEKVDRILDKARMYTGNSELEVDQDVLAYELKHNDHNLGLSYLLRNLGMLDGDVEENLAVYLSICAISVTARELAIAGATLANAGTNPLTRGRALSRTYIRDVVTVLMTCGMYDVAGQWAYDVGIPAKSGVGGGTLAAMPGLFGLGLFSAGLDVHGHSVRGVEVCRELSNHYGLHIFAPATEHTFGEQ